MIERYFNYPQDVAAASALCETSKDTFDVYFCAQLLDRKKRSKDAISRCIAIWADLDTCDPTKLLVHPSLVVQSSPGRWQGYWRLDDPIEGEIAERLAKRIAYYHADEGCDRSGWDLTQLLRVPDTKNHKYDDKPIVALEWEVPGAYRLQDFTAYPDAVDTAVEKFPYPQGITDTAEGLLTEYDDRFNNSIHILYDTVPEKDWSGRLWNLILALFEADLTREQVFVLCRGAKCNKYARDSRSDTYLWSDVVRGFLTYQNNAKRTAPSIPKPTRLMSDQEYENRTTDTFIDRYIHWASSLGDAATQYHQAGGFVILSALLSGRVHLPTSFGIIKPNVWFMLLADTTLTRKSTAMDIAMDLLNDIDGEPLLATDGSLEGLLGGLAVRAGIPSIFLRDEFSGLLEQMVKKDYYAGFAEMLTKLYDGKMQKRVLRKETIEIRDPTLILFAGGIKNRVCSLLTAEHVSSGFIPRFIFITAESDTSRIKPMGPPTQVDTTGKESLLDEMRSMITRYASTQEQIVTQDPITKKTFVQLRETNPFMAELTPEAWDRYNRLEHDMMVLALDTDRKDYMTPTYDRLCKSGLRVAILIAASMQHPEAGSKVRVGLEHILSAIAYVQGWKDYVDEVLTGVGTTAYEVRLDQIRDAVRKQPGVTRSELMRAYHLNARDANNLFETLIQRGEIKELGKHPVTYTSIGVYA
jgi:hypothetical protein